MNKVASRTIETPSGQLHHQVTVNGEDIVGLHAPFILPGMVGIERAAIHAGNCAFNLLSLGADRSVGKRFASEASERGREWFSTMQQLHELALEKEVIPKGMRAVYETLDSRIVSLVLDNS